MCITLITIGLVVVVAVRMGAWDEGNLSFGVTGASPHSASRRSGHTAVRLTLPSVTSGVARRSSALLLVLLVRWEWRVVWSVHMGVSDS